MADDLIDTLIDAGPLIAVLSRRDKHHSACARIIQDLDCAFCTTLPVLTEAMYIVRERVGWAAQDALWKMILRGDLVIQHPTPADLLRMSVLMDKHSDRPMDSADASLVALAERLSLTRIFTVDRSDFSTYRMAGKKALHDRRPVRSFPLARGRQNFPRISAGKSFPPPFRPRPRPPIIGLWISAP